MIRIVAGELGGRRLRTPPGLQTRPTSERVRAALFNILGPIRDGAVVWDLCAGSGALGIEALSRGAGRAVFVDQDAAACRVLRRNLQELGLLPRAQVIELPLGRFLSSQQRKAEPVDLLLADPPYASDEIGRLLDFLSAHGSGRLSVGAKVVIETDVRNQGELVAGARRGHLLCSDARRYGDTVLLFWELTPIPAS